MKNFRYWKPEEFRAQLAKNREAFQEIINIEKMIEHYNKVLKQLKQLEKKPGMIINLANKKYYSDGIKNIMHDLHFKTTPFYKKIEEIL